MKAVLAEAAQRIAQAGREEARLKAELLAAHVLGVGRMDLLAGQAPAWTRDLRARFDALAARVAAGEPLQYVTGEAWCWGRRFAVDLRVLIPRPETEELIQHVLDDGALWRTPAPAVADVGTGSGCIAISLAAERPGARLLAIDRSPGALDIARANAAAHGVAERIGFRCGDLLHGAEPGSLAGVVANLPYVPTAECDALAEEVRAHEPRLALDGGADGLDLVRRLLPQALEALAPGGRLWLEIGDGQGVAAQAALTRAGYADAQARCDTAGHDRFVSGTKP